MRIIEGVALKTASGELRSGLPGSLQSQRGPVERVASHLNRCRIESYFPPGGVLPA